MNAREVVDPYQQSCIFLRFCGKKVAKTFGVSEKSPYLCTRKRERYPWLRRGSNLRSLLTGSSARAETSFFEILTNETSSTRKYSKYKKKPSFLTGLGQPSGWMSVCFKTDKNSDFSEKDILQWRVWSWLRMNASYRLNTCKSRGIMVVACYRWWRPAHGWVTRIQPALSSGIALWKED